MQLKEKINKGRFANKIKIIKVKLNVLLINNS